MNLRIHNQRNMDTVKKFKAVYILMQNSEIEKEDFAFVSLNVVLACFCKRAISWDAKNKALPADIMEVDFPTLCH